MTIKNRIVLDTNVLISAILKRDSLPRKVVELSVANHIILLSDATFSELNTRLLRSKFDTYVSKETRQRFITNLSLKAEWVEISESIQACSDPDDNKFLELAVCGKTDYLVTGDRELLDLGIFQGVSIVTPRQFIES